LEVNEEEEERTSVPALIKISAGLINLLLFFFITLTPIVECLIKLRPVTDNEQGSKLIQIDRLRARGTSLGGVPREQEMLKGHLPRVMYHQVY